MLKEEGLESYLEIILPNIDESTVSGIAKKAIDDGYRSLSDAQKYTLENGISDYIMDKCPNCGEDIEYDDMEIAIFNDKCSSCQRDWDENYVD